MSLLIEIIQSLKKRELILNLIEMILKLGEKLEEMKSAHADLKRNTSIVADPYN